MSLINLIVAIVIGIAGICLLAYFAYLLIREVAVILKGGRNLLRFRKAESKIMAADVFIEANQYESALRVLEQAFVFDACKNRELITAAKDHNQTILSRCLIAAEEIGGSIAILPKIEHLLLERAEIQLLLLKTDEAFRKVSNKRELAGKELPSWSKKDYSQKIAQIKSQLEKNEKDLLSSLKVFFAEIKKPPSDNVTIH
ncbi:MAG: hypothetical protein IT291_06245 [Deltaproteobacteria bacterium]|nr:hypothetical protein [Deltaproteobacteria bacterium]